MCERIRSISVYKGDREGGRGKELWKLRGCERERESVCVCLSEHDV